MQEGREGGVDLAFGAGLQDPFSETRHRQPGLCDPPQRHKP